MVLAKARQPGGIGIAGARTVMPGFDQFEKLFAERRNQRGRSNRRASGDRSDGGDRNRNGGRDGIRSGHGSPRGDSWRGKGRVGIGDFNGLKDFYRTKFFQVKKTGCPESREKTLAGGGGII